MLTGLCLCVFCVPCWQPPVKAASDDDEADAAPSQARGGAKPAPTVTITPDGSRVELVKQEGGMTLMREVKDGKVVGTTVSTQGPWS